MIEGLSVVCTGDLSARGGDAGLGASPGGAGGGGSIEQWSDFGGQFCKNVKETGGESPCSTGSGGSDTAIADFDWDGDTQSRADGDCATDNALIKLGALETCDGKDNDCDGVVDDGACSGCTA